MKVNFLGRFQSLFASAVLLLWLLIPGFAAGASVPTNQLTETTGIVYQQSASLTLDGQQLGGLNVLIVGWTDITSTIQSVTSSNGNTYVLAAGTQSNVDASEAIYVASNINAGNETVTVTFNAPVGAQDLRLIEYGGPPFLENTTNPIDGSVSNGGNSNPGSTGSLATAYANDVLVFSGTIDTGFSSMFPSCGTGCNTFTEITPKSPFFDIVADAEVTALGTYQGQASVANGGPGNWVMQMVALRVAGQVTIVNPAPTATLVTPNTSPEAGGVPIAITGTGFLAGAVVTVTDGTHTASAVNCTVASATTINCTSAPDFTTKTSPTIVVTNPDGQATTGLPFSYTASTPFTAVAGQLSVSGGSVNGGNSIKITGSDFASGAIVTFGGTRADKVTVIDSGTITANVPAGAVGAQTVTVTNPSGANGSPGQYTYSGGAGINFVQQNSAASVSAPFTLAQTAGNLNVVVIGWGDATSTIKTVTDSAGNTYVAAAAPTVGTNLTQAIYYAKNIKASGAGTNTVTVTFNTGPSNPDLRIVEYNGLDPANPLDGAAGAAGNGTFLDSGSLTPTGTGDIIVAAGTVAGFILVPGNACFGSSCAFATAVYSSSGNNVEHAFPTVSGTWDGTANQDASLPWVMQAVAFKQPVGAVKDFTIATAALSPASVAPGGSATSTVTITPENGFNSAVNLTCTITAPVPAGETCSLSPTAVTPGSGAVTSTLTVKTTSGTPVSSSKVTVTGTSGSLTHTSTPALTMTVVASGGGGFTLSASPTSGSVSAGGQTTSTITINPTGGFTGTVSLACAVTGGGTPAPVCSIPATATTTATLTMTTTAPHASLMRSSNVFYAMLLPLCGMTLLGASFGSRKKKVFGLLLIFLMVSGLLFLSACGGGSSSSGGGGGLTGGTPAGNYTVTVTGTSGSLAPQTTTFTLTVQ